MLIALLLAAVVVANTSVTVRADDFDDLEDVEEDAIADIDDAEPATLDTSTAVGYTHFLLGAGAKARQGGGVGRPRIQ